MEIIIPFSWRLPDVFVRSPDGVLHRVVRHATTTETIAKLESIPSNYHLDCECMLDNGEALAWIGENRYRQVNGGTIFTAEQSAAPPPADAGGDAQACNTLRDACRPESAPQPPTGPKNVVPSAVASLKTGNDWSLIRAWREHLNISTADMAARLGVDHSIYIELERPRPRPRQIILDRISAALGVTPDQLDDASLGGHFH
ncbi:MAG: helix-turn-helix domain-containing protein [Achromobacter pulmonis]|uniref:helix-turn-helix domain-containing protein n=1 Tax=Achromobacter TaxID=222 RepID=UPI0012D0FB85|nr:helix-turn-helix transcriptional regulator [Achromobacter pulmonis]MCF7769315.1 helix-turn-helix domain-containing protein [Achromobacter pulmonis]MPT26766.1 XRE family transcriptional regulator [Achromobacter sp.]